MNRKAATKKSKSRLPVVEEPVELTGAEKLFENVRPHLSTIAMVVIAGLLGFAAIAVLTRSRFDKSAIRWREFATSTAIALRTGDISGLTDVAETYPDTKAGLWSLQVAGDQQLRMGIEQLSLNREAGFALIRKAKDKFTSIVDSADSAKTTMLERRSHFSLAYAHESLGEFEKAKELYQKIVTEAPDSAFAGPARRGLERASNADYAELYNKFVNWEEEVIGDAPGPAIPDRPVIDFPMTDIEPGKKPPANDGGPKSGGDFGTEKETSDSPAETETTAEETSANEPESVDPDADQGESEKSDAEDSTPETGSDDGKSGGDASENSVEGEADK